MIKGNLKVTMTTNTGSQPKICAICTKPGRQPSIPGSEITCRVSPLDFGIIK
jgi:hypothetical protein